MLTPFFWSSFGVRTFLDRVMARRSGDAALQDAFLDSGAGVVCIFSPQMHTRHPTQSPEASTTRARVTG
jgi:hypothetical protein